MSDSAAYAVLITLSLAVATVNVFVLVAFSKRLKDISDSLGYRREDSKQTDR